MANYPKLHQTNAGRELIARANATGKAIKYVKISTGDGVLTNQNLDTLNSLIAPKLELPFTSPGKVIGNGQFQLEFALSNATVTNGFYAREIGVYAKLDGESDATAKLVAYTNGGNFVDYIPNKDTPINSKVFQVDVIIGNSENVIVQRVDAAYLTKGAMDAHNSDTNAHADIRAQITSDINAHNSDTSAHTPITDQIKAILGDTNWQENPVSNLKDIKNLLGQGAIVASKLDANAGFVKFANGFTIQWGRRTELTIYDNYKYEESFPIAFDQKCIGVLVTLEGRGPVSGASVAYTDNRSLTEFTIVADASNAVAKSDLFYIAIGA